jgi:hypothetical protein
MHGIHGVEISLQAAISSKKYTIWPLRNVIFFKLRKVIEKQLDRIPDADAHM